MQKNKFLILSFLAGTILSSNELSATIIHSGNCGSGDACTYTIDDQGVLTISGQMPEDGYASISYWENGVYFDHTAAPWGYYQDVVTTINLTDGITVIPFGAFYNMDHVSEISLPDSVTSIEGQAFEEMSGLKNINFGDQSQLTHIGYGAFLGTSIQELNIPNGVAFTSDEYPFAGMDHLQKLTIPENLKVDLTQFLDFSKIDYSDSDMIDALYCARNGDYEYLNNIISDVEANGGWTFTYLPTIECKGDPDNCKANLYWPEELNDYFNPLASIKVKEATYAEPNGDGSSTIKTWSGNIIGYKGKRIYTIEEANAVAGEKNRISIRYR